MKVLALAGLLFLHLLPGSRANCAIYGCTPSLSFTNPTDFYPEPEGDLSRPARAEFWPDLAYSVEDKELVPTGAGCVTNNGKIVCPFHGKGKNYLLSWDIFSQYAQWNTSMKALPTLPAIDTYGQLYAADGSELCAFQSNGKPFGHGCIEMIPTTGPLFDLTVVADRYLYLLYKCGFMVAYFISDGTAFASIWLNETYGGVNGTFVPLSNPAVVGERVYFMAAFKPTPPVSQPGVHLRLYAIDVRSIMVKRIAVIWTHDIPLSDGSIPYMMGEQVDCAGKSNPLDEPVAHVFFNNGTVVGFVNYANLACTDKAKCSKMSATHSLLVSVTDKGASYDLNFLKRDLSPFQAVAYASPNFTQAAGGCGGSNGGGQLAAMPRPSTGMWVSWADSNGNSIVEELNMTTGSSIQRLDMAEFKDVKITSKLNVFYNDQLMQCSSNTSTGDERITPLIFGFTSGGKTKIAAVDITPARSASVLWSVKGPLSAVDPVVGQMTSVGKGRSSMMAITTTKGAYFYILFAEK